MQPKEIISYLLSACKESHEMTVMGVRGSAWIGCVQTRSSKSGARSSGSVTSEASGGQGGTAVANLGTAEQVRSHLGVALDLLPLHRDKAAFRTTFL